MSRNSGHLVRIRARGAARSVLIALLVCAGVAPAPALDQVTVSASTPVAYEAGPTPGAFTITRTGSTGSLTVNYTVAGTATAGADYTALAGSVSFVQGETAKVIPVMPIDDAANEGTESVTLTLTAAPAYIVGTTPSAQVLIADNDMTATVQVPDPVADEDASLFGFTTDPDVRRRGVIRVAFAGVAPTTRPKSATVSFAGTATLTTDYNLTYKIGANSQCGFASDLSGNTSGLGYTVVAAVPGDTSVPVSAGTGTITSGSTVTFDGDSTVYTVTSDFGGGSLHISPGLTKSVVNGAAVTDTTPAVAPATTPSGFVVNAPYTVGAQTVKVDLGSGGIFAGDAIQFDGDDNSYVVTASTVAAVSSFGTISFKRYQSATSASGSPGLGVAIGGASNVTTTFSATTMPLAILVPDLATKVEFSVAPKSDGAIEGAETAVMTLLADNDYALVNPTVGTVALADRDVVADIVLGANAGKPSTSGNFLVTFSHAFAKKITVPYTITGTAVAGTDYVALPGSVDIPAGATSISIPVSPLATAANGPTTLTLTLDSTLDYKLAGSGSSSTNPSATLNITDAIGTVSLAASTPTAVEDPTAPTAGVFTVSLVRNTAGTPAVPVAGAVNVAYTISGTAVAGSRYAVLSGSVTIPDGQNSAQITVTPIDDVAYEGTQSVVATLAAGQGYAINGASAVAQVNITDDEPVISIARLADATRPSSSGSFTVSYPGVPAGTALTRAVVVPLTYTGTAIRGTDFSAPASITIPAGARSATVVVSPVTSTTTSTVTVTATLGADASYGVATAAATLTINPVSGSATGGTGGTGGTAGGGTKPDVGTVSTAKSGGCGRGAGLIVAAGCALCLVPTRRIRRRRR